jgi:hypothetical protein
VGLVPPPVGAQGEAPAGHADARRRARPPRRAHCHGAGVAGDGLPRVAGSRIPPPPAPGSSRLCDSVRRRPDPVERGRARQPPGGLGARAHGGRAGPSHRVALRAGLDRRHRGLGPVRRGRHRGPRDDPRCMLRRVKQVVRLGTDRIHALRQAIQTCRKGRHGLDPRRLRRAPGQGAVRRGLRQGADLRMGQTHVHRHPRPRRTECGTTRPTTAPRSSSIPRRDPSSGPKAAGDLKPLTTSEGGALPLP